MASKSEILLMALAVKQGLIQKDQVQAAMNIQKDMAGKGQSVRLEQVAISNGFITAEQVASMRSPAAPTPASEPKGITLEEARRIPIFDFHEIIGQGGMATVFSGTHKETGQPRAIKVLFKEHVKVPQFVQRFVREGKLLKEFDCASIARGYEYGRAGDELYFMGMELIHGPSLQEMLDAEGPFSEQKAVHCIVEAAKGLAYMQSRGIVHRDVKPENIMWNTDGRIMLVDLGFATPIRNDVKPGEYEDETCGTVQYISPEQAKGKADLDIRADIYSLGATLYHLVIGKLPFSGKDSMEVMSKQVMESLDAHKLKGGKVSMHMHYFIEKMMAKEREIRYQSAQEAVDDILTVLSGFDELKYNPDADTAQDPFAQMSKRLRVISGGPRSSVAPGTRTSVRTPATQSGSASGRYAPPPGSNRMPQTGPVSQRVAPAPAPIAGKVNTTRITRAAPPAGASGRTPAVAPQQPQPAPGQPGTRQVRMPLPRRKGG